MGNFTQNQTSQKKATTKATKKGQNDFLSGLSTGFLSNKKTKKKKKKQKKANAVVPTKPVSNEEIKKKKDGYYILPEIEAYKDAQGNIFLAIGPRKVSSDLSAYTFLRCIVSLKNKLRNKKANESEYEAVLIDFRSLSESQREIERKKLVKGYENVISFILSSVHFINCIQAQKTKTLDFDQALLQYQEDGIFINTKPVHTPKNEFSESEQKETPKTSKSVTPESESKNGAKSESNKSKKKESAKKNKSKSIDSESSKSSKTVTPKSENANSELSQSENKNASKSKKVQSAKKKQSKSDNAPSAKNGAK